MGCEMKKYVFLFLMCCPLVAFGAPSVRALGSNAVSGTVGATAANKVTPVKASVVSSDRGSSVARVGSLRAKATTTATSGANSASTSRFPVILPTKVYNTANTPRPTGASSSTIINTDVDLTEIEQKIENNTNNITTNTNNIQTNTTNISGNTTRIENLEGQSDSIRVGGADKPADFDDSKKDSNRAWIWVEQ